MGTALGDLLKKAREAKGLTQAKLGIQIGHSRTYIFKIEAGIQRGSFTTLFKIAKALDLPPDLVLSKAGFNIPKEQSEKLELELEDYQFSKLDPKVKRVLLDIAPIVVKYIEGK